MEKKWNKVLEKIHDQISAANFRAWFAHSQGLYSQGKLLIKAPSSFIKEQLSIKYLPILQQAINEVYGFSVPLEFKVDPQLDTAKKITESADLELDFTAPLSTLTTGLNSKHSLENFMVGLSNNLAYAAAQAVIHNPGLSYNPLFVYGGTGVGKTHLMHAIGNALLKKNPAFKIVCCSSETFTNDFIQSIQTKKTGDFRARYRLCQALLIDDIQFIAGRDSTQEEFFHTFNELHAKNKQIVLTSDRPPQEMQKLEARLLSRFQGGLMVDIQLPDFDTRVAILKAKCREREGGLPDEILTLIAQYSPCNARELEGKLMQIIQTVKLSGQSITYEAIKNLLGQPAVIKKTDHKRVLSLVNQYFNIKMADITGPRRKKGLVLPRQLAMFLLYDEYKLPFEKIGDILGGRDHTTIMHGVEKIREAVNRDREIQRMLIELKQNLNS